MEDFNSTEVDLHDHDLLLNSDIFLEELQKVVTECEPSCIICYKLIIQLRHHTTRAHSILQTQTQDQCCQTDDPQIQTKFVTSPIFKCDICEEELSTELSLQSHLASHSPQPTKNNSDQILRRSVRNRKTINYANESRTLLPETTKFTITSEDTLNNNSAVEEDDDVKCEPIEFDDPLYYPNEESDGEDKDKSDDEEEIPTHKIDESKRKKRAWPRKRNKKAQQFICKFCHVDFSDGLQLNDHYYDNHLASEVEDCTMCGEKFSGKKAFTDHILLNHKNILSNPYKCTVSDCDMNFSKATELQKHLEQSHPTHLHFVCNVCQKRFPRRHELGQHILIHGSEIDPDAGIIDSHEEEERLFGCNICKRVFNSNSHLSTHLQRKHKHLLTLEYACRICKEKFFARVQLTRHFTKSHPGDKPFKCKDCNTQFQKESLFSLHCKIHTGEKTNACTHCTKTFRTKVQLNRHSRVHTGEKRYRCDECGKEFTKSCSLNIHKRIHTGEKPYMCDHCSKFFRSSKQLNSHMVIHAVESGMDKPHVCKECGKRFTAKSGLITHSVTHTKKKSHQCAECGKCFALPHQLRAHRGTHTGK